MNKFYTLFYIRAFAPAMEATIMAGTNCLFVCEQTRLKTQWMYLSKLLKKKKKKLFGWNKQIKLWDDLWSLKQNFPQPKSKFDKAWLV